MSLLHSASKSEGGRPNVENHGSKVKVETWNSANSLLLKILPLTLLFARFCEDQEGLAPVTSPESIT
jgi:hypothetical protein